ncbi:RTA1-domain-containing protein [Acephala macrosclerotiorum]|nr:RTA1-domain-containing protein [Acephala macrosclerotiorum]
MPSITRAAMDQVVEVLLSRAVHNAKNCTKDTCSVKDSVYGYYPSKPVNIILVAIFAISMFAHFYQGIRSKSWTFLVALGIGTLGEAVGYVGRILLRSDPFSKAYLGIQLVCLTVAPAFIAGGIYLTLKHLIIVYGSQFSRITPQWYTRIFISCDIASILIQSAGAVMASRGTASSVSAGNNTMMVGLVFQVMTLAVFGVMAVDVFFRIRRHRGEFTQSAENLRASKRFKGLMIAIAVAYIAIEIRCLYRIAEMAGGWRNPIMQDQVAFIILDGVMCVIAVVALNVFHPGFLFEQSYATLKAEGIQYSEEMATTTHSSERK